MIKVRAVCPPGVNPQSLINGVVGFDGACERKIDEVFEMPDHCSEGDHSWFVILGGPTDEAPPAANAAEGEGVAYSQSHSAFHTDEDKLPAYADEIPV